MHHCGPRDFMAQLEAAGDLRRIAQPVPPTWR